MCHSCGKRSHIRQSLQVATEPGSKGAHGCHMESVLAILKIVQEDRYEVNLHHLDAKSGQPYIIGLAAT